MALRQHIGEHGESVETPDASVATGAPVVRRPLRAFRERGDAGPAERGRLSEIARTRAASIALFGGLLAISFALKVRGIGSAYWIDEGLSVGIASHPLTDIPGVLRLDGSPPLYYMLLHVWQGWLGSEEVATQTLSLIIGVLCMPAAFWVAHSLFGRRAAWATAALTAVSSFLTFHSYETRMYALMTLLSLLASGAFVNAFVYGRPRWAPVFGGLLALMLYTHNWAFFFAAASVAGVVYLHRRAGDPRALLRPAAIAFGLAALLYLPWIPTLLSQIAHTGAPWSNVPSPRRLVFHSATIAGGNGPAVAVLFGVGAGFAAMTAMGRWRERRAGEALLFLCVGTILIAYLSSLVSPAWATRYLAVALGPMLLLAGLGFARAGRVGVAALAMVLFFNALPLTIEDEPGDERDVAAELSPLLTVGDYVIVTHPERVPIMEHYLRPGLHYADLFGPVKDPLVTDWRDAMERVKPVRVANSLMPMLDAMPVGRRLLLVRPLWSDSDSWEAPWTEAVRLQSRHWTRAIAQDPRFRQIASAPNPYNKLEVGVRGSVWVKARP
jgi:hypothetical protein